ncbi:hypothetical protein ACMFMF_011390 [Clarireedia jacksonii]
MEGSRYQGYYFGIESTDDYSVPIEQAHYEGGSQYKSFTPAYHSQDAPPTYERTTRISESPVGRSSLNSKDSTYEAEAPATTPNLPNNSQQWSPQTPFVEYNYARQPFASYGNPGASSGIGSEVSVSQTHPQVVQYQTYPTPSSNLPGNDLQYNQQISTQSMAASTIPTGQVYPYVAEQSYSAVNTQAGFQSDYSRRSRGNHSYDEQQEAEPPDPRSESYYTNSNVDQAQEFQQRSDSQPTNSFPAWQMSSQPLPLGYNAPGGNTSCAPPSYPGSCQHPACLSGPKKSTVFQKEKDWENHNYRTHAKRFHCKYPGCGMMRNVTEFRFTMRRLEQKFTAAMLQAAKVANNRSLEVTSSRNIMTDGMVPILVLSQIVRAGTAMGL